MIQFQNEFQVGVEEVGRIPTWTQLGYAGGMLLLTPLGDRYNRKNLILLATFSVCCALLLMALSTQFIMLEIASGLIGFVAVGAHIIIPHVAQIAVPERRGEAVGRVMTGLLLGILLARTLSGFVGSLWGWRTVYSLSALLMMALGFVMMRVLPHSKPSFAGSYWSLLKSVVRLAWQEPVLRESALIGGCLFGSFSAVWATLIFLVSAQPFELGAKTAGLFGLLGAAGALTASVVGRATDKFGPLRTLLAGLAITFLSFVELGFSGASLTGLIVGIFVMDAGVQAAHVSNQSRFFRIRPEARSRMNTVYMFTYFVGGAMGSLLGAQAWQRWGWIGVCGFSLVLIAAAGLIALKSCLIASRQPA